MIVCRGLSLANYVPAAAVRREGLVLSNIIRCKESVGCFLNYNINRYF